MWEPAQWKCHPAVPHILDPMGVKVVFKIGVIDLPVSTGKIALGPDHGHLGEIIILKTGKINIQWICVL
jgi:hypothetical protein